MTDYSELSDMPARSAQRKLIEQHDALEAQAKRIAELEEKPVRDYESDLYLRDARIAELEKENRRLRDLAYIAYQNGYKDAPPYSKYERSLDEIEIMWERSFACAALKGEK
jgi:hypothetical protein